MAKIDQVIEDIGAIKIDMGIMKTDIGSIKSDIFQVKNNGKEMSAKVDLNRNNITKLKERQYSAKEIKDDTENKSGKNYVLYGAFIGLGGAVIASLILKFL